MPLPADPHHDAQRKKISVSIYISALLTAVMGIVHLAQIALGTHWYQWSIEPRTLKGLRGIVFAPLLHSDWEHYVSNAMAMLVLFAVAIFFYRVIAYRVLFWVWLLDGVGVWLLGRDSYHLGASGLVYGLAAFLLFSGMLRKNRSLMAISMFVVIGYGSLIWGMMPVLEHISWEAHLFGFLAGIALSIVYRRQGPQNDPVPEWYFEEETGDDAPANRIEPPQPPSSTDPLFPQAPSVAPRVTPVPPSDSQGESDNPGNENNDPPRIRIRYNYKK